MSNETLCIECGTALDVATDENGLRSATCEKCGAAYVESGMAGRMCKRYVCAGCYGRLYQKYFTNGRDRDLVLVYCLECGTGRGYVTKSHAERKQAESAAEAAEARSNIGDILGIENDLGDADKILKDLGF